jgi:DNA-binding LacI/PurR family transcriptional regulator
MAHDKPKTVERNAAPRLVDLAQLAGFSVATVSRALADHPAISDETKNRVKAIALEHGYALRENPAGSPAHRRKDRKRIGVVMPAPLSIGSPLANPFELSLLGGIGAALRDRHFDFSVACSAPHDDKSLARFMAKAKYDGTIFIGQAQYHVGLNRLAEAGRNIVVWGVEAEGQKYCSIGSDNFQGGFRATSHLIRLGRQRIVFLGQSPALAAAQTGLSQSAVRLEGCRAALEAAGLPLDPVMVQAAAGTSEAGAEAVVNLMERNVEFDGIVAASDVMAIGAICALQMRGRHVPRDVSVIGYDDSEFARYAQPRLTTVRQDTMKAGNLLVSKLLRLMDGHAVTSERLPTDIVVRDSCGA